MPDTITNIIDDLANNYGTGKSLNVSRLEKSPLAKNISIGDWNAAIAELATRSKDVQNIVEALIGLKPDLEISRKSGVLTEVLNTPTSECVLEVKSHTVYYVSKCTKITIKVPSDIPNCLAHVFVDFTGIETPSISVEASVPVYGTRFNQCKTNTRWEVSIDSSASVVCKMFGGDSQ
jgi:hypothetical protein